MSAASPSQDAGSLLGLEIRSDGEAVEAEIVSVETWSAASRIPRARIALADGSVADADFPLSESEQFAPGRRIEIAAGYGGELEIVHAGVVVRHGLKVVPGERGLLIVETADPLLKMTLSRSNALSAATNDKDAAAALVAKSGGSVAKNELADDPHESLVQFHASDWDMLLTRAEANGCLVFVTDKEVAIRRPALGTAAAKLEYGDDIIGFDGMVDAASQAAASAVKSRAWSHAEQKVREAAGSAPGKLGPGDLDSATLADVLSPSEVHGQSGANLSEARLDAWSTAVLLRAELARVQARVTFQGTSAVTPGCTIALAGLGSRFDGDAYVTAVHHRILEGRWLTTAAVGMAAESFARPGGADPAAPPAGGLMPPARGLHAALVTAVSEDPEGDFRIKVTIPLIAETGLWARLAQPYASSGFGIAFHPEVGDEVALAFLDEDPANPVIVGSLYSRTRKPTYPANKENDKKAIVTRSKMEITFDDKDVVLEVKTPAGRLVRLDDKAKTVTITDPFANKIVMSEAKVEMIAAKEMVLTSGTDFKINCGASMTVKATANYTLNAQQIAATAAAKLALVSNAMGELKAGAVLTVGGALVKIN